MFLLKIIHPLKWKVKWRGELTFSMGEGEIFWGEGSGGEGGGGEGEGSGVMGEGSGGWGPLSTLTGYCGGFLKLLKFRMHWKIIGYYEYFQTKKHGFFLYACAFYYIYIQTAYTLIRRRVLYLLCFTRSIFVLKGIIEFAAKTFRKWRYNFCSCKCGVLASSNVTFWDVRPTNY